MKLSPFGEFVRKLRIAHRKTQEEHAKYLGIGAPYLSLMETGKREPRYEVLEKTIEFFNLDKRQQEEFKKAVEDSYYRACIPNTGYAKFAYVKSLLKKIDKITDVEVLLEIEEFVDQQLKELE